MNENVDIFIYSIKPFKPLVSSDVYKILTDSREPDKEFDTYLPILRDYEGDNISDKNLMFNEYTGLYWLYKNYPLKDYIGLNHYRRYYDYRDNLPDIESYFKYGASIILNREFPLDYNGVSKNNRDFYEIWHNVEDFDLMGEIIKKNYPQYADGWEEMSKAMYIHPSSMFIMKKEMFMEYIPFIMDVCNKFNEARGCKTSEDWVNYVTNNQDKYIRPNHLYYTIQMQSRVIGYLIERVLLAFLLSGGENSIKSRAVEFSWRVTE